MNHEKNAFIPTMSHREWEVFWLTATARYTDQEIASTLQLSVPTIKTHKRGIRNALGVHGNASIPRWYEQNRALVASEWLKKMAPQDANALTEPTPSNQTHEKVYGFLTGTADRYNGILGALGYIDSMPPIVAAFMRCHVELMRVTGIVVDLNDPPRPYLADKPHATLDSAQESALSVQSSVGLAALSEQVMWAQQSALGILAATSALLDKIDERTALQTDANNFAAEAVTVAMPVISAT